MKFKNLTKIKIITLVFTLFYIIFFGIQYISRGNNEFMGYVVGLVFFMVVIGLLNSKYNFSEGVLIGMSLWGLLHMSGGYFKIGGGVLYDYWLLPFLRYDQFVHAIGFGFATLLSYYLLKPYLKINKKIPLVISILIVLIGMGIGAFNEIVELGQVLAFKNTGVGDYFNNAWDLVFNTIGAIIAVVYVNLRKK